MNKYKDNGQRTVIEKKRKCRSYVDGVTGKPLWGRNVQVNFLRQGIIQIDGKPEREVGDEEGYCDCSLKKNLIKEH